MIGSVEAMIDPVGPRQLLEHGVADARPNGLARESSFSLQARITAIGDESPGSRCRRDVPRICRKLEYFVLALDGYGPFSLGWGPYAD